MDLVYCKQHEGAQGLLHTLQLNMFTRLLFLVKGFYRQSHFGRVQKKVKCFVDGSFLPLWPFSSGRFVASLIHQATAWRLVVLRITTTKGHSEKRCLFNHLVHTGDMRADKTWCHARSPGETRTVSLLYSHYHVKSTFPSYPQVKAKTLIQYLTQW